MAVDKECIGLVDNKGQMKFGLRMSELDLTAPPALTKGLVKTTVQGNVTPSVPTCNLNGSGTFSWLIQFDLAAGTIKTGGAKPVADATQGFSFVDDMVTQGGTTFHIQPVTYMAKPGSDGKFAITQGSDLIVPIYLDAMGTQVVLLPLHEAKLDMGTLTSDNNCIGSYNAAGLDPANSCLPDDTHPAFLTAGSLSGYITLEEADNVIVSALSESLCVLLSGDAATYGDGMKPIQKCKRTNGVINFQGDTCSTAGGTCKDASTLGANFAASSVKINN
jgi:hypothetical protein